MTIFEELERRGLIAQITDEAEIAELINNGKATFYIGFDPTDPGAGGKPQRPGHGLGNGRGLKTNCIFGGLVLY